MVTPFAEGCPAAQALPKEKTSVTGRLQAKAQHDGLPDLEREQAMEQWLRQVPDEPGELLRRKFLYEQRKRQEVNR